MGSILNRSYITRQTGIYPFKTLDGRGWLLELSNGDQLVSYKIKERDAYQELYDQFWAIRREEALARDRYRCRLCGSSSSLSVDHIQSRGSGGTDELRNLRSLCAQCHAARHG